MFAKAVQCTHRGEGASDTSQQEVLRLFERFQCQAARDGGEAVEKILQRIAAFQILEKRLHGNSRATKDGHAVLDFGIADNCFRHVSFLAQKPGECTGWYTQRAGQCQGRVVPRLRPAAAGELEAELTGLLAF